MIEHLLYDPVNVIAAVVSPLAAILVLWLLIHRVPPFDCVSWAARLGLAVLVAGLLLQGVSSLQRLVYLGPLWLAGGWVLKDVGVALTALALLLARHRSRND